MVRTSFHNLAAALKSLTEAMTLGNATPLSDQVLRAMAVMPDEELGKLADAMNRAIVVELIDATAAIGEQLRITHKSLSLEMESRARDLGTIREVVGTTLSGASCRSKRSGRTR